jgi:hypothetical protein
MNWQEIILSDDDLASDKASTLEIQFMYAFRNSGLPNGMVLMASKKKLENSGKAYYLSPVAAEHFKDFMAFYETHECQKPQDAESVIVAGNTGTQIRML